MKRAYSAITAAFFRVPRTVRISILVGLALRLLGLVWVVHAVGSSALIYGDGTGYVELAQNLVQGRGFGTMQDGTFVPEVFRTPGLPLLLAPFAGWPHGLLVYSVVLSLLTGIGLPLLVWWIGRHTLGERSGRIAAWLAACEPLFIIFSWLPLTEMPFLLFGLSSMAALICARRSKSWVWSAASGALAAFAVLIRPGNIFLFALSYLVLLAGDAWRRSRALLKVTAVIVAACLVCLLPWYVRTYRLTGAAALSGAGWRNVYTDYLASLRSVEHGTTFWDEKAKLKADAETQLGLSRVDLNSPANSAILRKVALNELLQHPLAVVKLESLLMVSFFTNDGYYSYLVELGLVPHPDARISPTYAFLRQGFGAFGAIFQSLAGQYFIPLLGRLVTVAIFLAAVAGVIRSRKPVRWLFVALIIVAAFTASAIGLGVEGRLRLSIAPLLFLLAGAAFEPRPRAATHDHA